MTDAERAELKAWADDFAAVGMVQARQVKELLTENERLRAFSLLLAHRVVGLVEIVARTAERSQTPPGV